MKGEHTAIILLLIVLGVMCGLMWNAVLQPDQVTLMFNERECYCPTNEYMLDLEHRLISYMEREDEIDGCEMWMAEGDI